MSVSLAVSWEAMQPLATREPPSGILIMLIDALSRMSTCGLQHLAAVDARLATPIWCSYSCMSTQGICDGRNGGLRRVTRVQHLLSHPTDANESVVMCFSGAEWSGIGGYVATVSRGQERGHPTTSCDETLSYRNAQSRDSTPCLSEEPRVTVHQIRAGHGAS